jgi:hypothetical protein
MAPSGLSIVRSGWPVITLLSDTHGLILGSYPTSRPVRYMIASPARKPPTA